MKSIHQKRYIDWSFISFITFSVVVMLAISLLLADSFFVNQHEECIGEGVVIRIAVYSTHQSKSNSTIVRQAYVQFSNNSVIRIQLSGSKWAVTNQGDKVMVTRKWTTGKVLGLKSVYKYSITKVDDTR